MNSSLRGFEHHKLMLAAGTLLVVIILLGILLIVVDGRHGENEGGQSANMDGEEDSLVFGVGDDAETLLLGSNNISAHVLDAGEGSPAVGVNCTAYYWNDANEWILLAST